ncbi:MAG: Gfo/Idh/MocA family oxidoreductase [Gemmataceae bacterium]|nr:Gfo/Idh/MocA family oxidoreductase [Gemmataceae bacterium]
MKSIVRIGVIGAGANTRSKHIPGFQAISGVEVVAVCNRRPESSAAVAKEFNIPRAMDRWEDLIADPSIDAVMVGTWPYLHCPIVLAALSAGKHVLTEARLAMNANEAHQMLTALERNPTLVGQVVPSPFGLRGDRFVRKLLGDGYIGQVREVTVLAMNNAFGGHEVPLHWRQDATLSGLNMLQLGIVHETLSRWLSPTSTVLAQAHAFVGDRLDPSSGIRRTVGTPDSVGVLAKHANGVQAVYQLSGVTPVGNCLSISLRGSAGMLHYDLLTDRLSGLTVTDMKAGRTQPEDLPIPAEFAGGWRVEADFIDSIREGSPVQYTSFSAGVAYMEFTEAVAKSARSGVAVAVGPV